MPLDAFRQQLANVTNPAKCNGCALKIAREIGADHMIVGEVYKVSNLIQSENLRVIDVASGELVRGLAVDIRGNTDKAWKRGMDFILRTHVFANN